MFHVRSSVLAALTLSATVAALVAGASSASARPAPDGPPALVTPATSSQVITHSASAWTFVLVVAITAVVVAAATISLTLATLRHQARSGGRGHRQLARQAG
jgi:hypothetical protein